MPRSAESLSPSEQPSAEQYHLLSNLVHAISSLHYLCILLAPVWNITCSPSVLVKLVIPLARTVALSILPTQHRQLVFDAQEGQLFTVVCERVLERTVPWSMHSVH
jgi:hypothetical protein